MKKEDKGTQLAKMLICKAFKISGELRLTHNIKSPYEVYFEDDKYIYIVNGFCFYCKNEEKRRWCYRIFRDYNNTEDTKAIYKYINPENFKLYKNMEELDAEALTLPFI